MLPSLRLQSTTIPFPVLTHADSTLSSSLTNGGTAGLFWTYVIVALGFLLVYASLAEMASMYASPSVAVYTVAETVSQGANLWRPVSLGV